MNFAEKAIRFVFRRPAQVQGSAQVSSAPIEPLVEVKKGDDFYHHGRTLVVAEVDDLEVKAVVAEDATLPAVRFSCRRALLVYSEKRRAFIVPGQEN